MHKLTLLYIEDDLEILENMSFLLNRYVQKVYTAKDGEEALQIYYEHKPDIVVSDVNLPKLNGLALSKKIREENKTIPIIFISAFNDDEKLQTAEELSASAYIVKPFNLDTLNKTINQVIEKNFNSNEA